mmetsp:Transcript_73848/g.213941  ORF Transcript_73848/g.213941 Transcript_73848/m.213941 type:complete len:224 (+) Transcript_73848:363-1034(+)
MVPSFPARSKCDLQWSILVLWSMCNFDTRGSGPSLPLTKLATMLQQNSPILYNLTFALPEAFASPFVTGAAASESSDAGAAARAFLDTFCGGGLSATCRVFLFRGFSTNTSDASRSLPRPLLRVRDLCRRPGRAWSRAGDRPSRTGAAWPRRPSRDQSSPRWRWSPRQPPPPPGAHDPGPQGRAPPPPPQPPPHCGPQGVGQAPQPSAAKPPSPSSTKSIFKY